jgi:hypothetical protein
MSKDEDDSEHSRRPSFPLTPPHRLSSTLHLSRPPKAYSFAAAGWLKLYFFGVASFLQDHGLDKKANFVGSSAGSLTAAGLVLGVDFRAVRDFALKCVEDTHGHITPAFRLHEMVENCLKMMLDDKAHERLEGRLEVSVTALPSCSNRRYKSFTSEEDFHQALLASCRMAPLAGLPFLYRGEYVFDGGLSDFQPMLDDDTITVSPFFFSDADIRPSRYVPPWWSMYPPRREDIAWLFDLGYHDAKLWSKKSGAAGAAAGGSVSFFSTFQKDHSLSFGRFWGYRSIGRIVPSWMMTVLFGMFFILIVRPFSMFCIFVELFVKTFFYGLCTIFFWSTFQSKSQTTSWGQCKTSFSQIINPELFIRGLVPGFSWCLPLNKAQLLKSSLCFRVAVHYL